MHFPINLLLLSTAQMKPVLIKFEYWIHLSAIGTKQCAANDEVYESGDSFFPNCGTECFCIDGALGCRKVDSVTGCSDDPVHHRKAAYVQPITAYRSEDVEKGTSGVYYS